MSDTTITPEERAEWRERLTSKFSCFDAVLSGFTLRLLNVLEQTEARAEKAEKELAGADAEITELRDELEDSRGTEKDAPNILCAIARLVGVYEHCQEIGDDMGDMTLDAVRELLADKQKSEAEVARLQQRVNELLSEELTDCAVRERIQLRFNMHEVLQQNERLTQMLDWLAKVCAMHCRDKSTDDSECNISDCAPVHCSHASADQWKEAASKAVAGEE